MVRLLPRYLAVVALTLATTVGFAADLFQPPPDGTPVRAVEVKGLAKLSQSDIERYMELKPGSTFTEESMRRDLAALAGSGKIDPLSLEIAYEEIEGGVKIVLSLKETELLQKIQFVGNVKYNADQLRAEIELKDGEALPPDARSRAARAIQRFYSNAGYKGARIDARVDSTSEPGNALLTVTIDEGERIRIDDLIIRGNNHFTGARLRMAVLNAGSWFIFDNFYDDRAFDDDLRTIEGMYRDAGFLDATAKRGEFLYDSDRAEVSPVIEITEGPRYRISSVTLNGITLFNPAESREPFDRLVGKWFDGEDYGDAVDALRRLYGNEGYADAEIDGRFEKDAAAGTVALIVDVRENDVVYVGRVRVAQQRFDYNVELTGVQKAIEWLSPPTKTETILREVRMTPGERYRTDDEVRTVERIRNLRYFDKVRVRREATDDPKVRDAVIEVEESPTAGHFFVTAGVGERSGASVSVGYRNPNLFGEADTFNASVTFGSRSRSFRLGYMNRYIGDSDVSYRFDAFRDYDRYRVYAQRTYGIWNEFGQPVSEYSSIYYRLRTEHTNFSRIEGDPEYDFDSYYTIAGRAMYVQDRTDNVDFPTRGYKFAGGAEVGYADGFLLKGLHTYDRYFSLGNDWVYAYGHQVGLMPRDADKIGLGERFFVGGSGDLRGFAPREVGPRDPGNRRLAVGGATRLTQRHELRYPFTKYLRGRLFTDMAILEDEAFSLGRPRIGSGFGLGADLGPVVVDVDLGFAVLKRRRDRTRVLSFRIGSNF